MEFERERLKLAIEYSVRELNLPEVALERALALARAHRVSPRHAPVLVLRVARALGFAVRTDEVAKVLEKLGVPYPRRWLLRLPENTEQDSKAGGLHPASGREGV